MKRRKILKPSTHIATGFIAGFILAPFWGIVQSIFFFLTSVLVDVDRVIVKKRPPVLYVFHTVEFLAAVKLLDVFIKHDFISAVLTGIFWGAIFHMTLDTIDAIRAGALFNRAYSVIEYLIRTGKYKKFIFSLLIVWIVLTFGFAVTPNLNLDFSLKVIGHVLWFAILTFLLYRVSKALVIAAPVAFLFALLAEGCQKIFIPSRGGSLRDVGIDCIGILITAGVYYVFKIRKNKKKVIS